MDQTVTVSMIARRVMAMVVLMLMGKLALHWGRHGRSPQMPMRSGVGVAVDVASVAVDQRFVHAFHHEPSTGAWQLFAEGRTESQ
jgi:hypothetical protein